MCAAEMKMPGMASELIMDLRGTLEWLKQEGDLMETELEVIDGMGHVITPSLAPLIVERVDRFIRERT